MPRYAVTITGPAGAYEAWDEHLDALGGVLIGWPEGPPVLGVNVVADAPMEAVVAAVKRLRDVGILDERAVAAEPLEA